MAGIKHARIHYVVSEGVQIWRMFLFFLFLVDERIQIPL